MVEGPPRRPRPPAAPATFGVFAPSGSVDPARLEAAVLHLKGAGHRVIVAGEALGQWRYFSGTDEQRLAGLDRLLDDPAIDVVIAARGGYGISRVLEGIDWARVGASGKAFCGFSDFTAFNCAALALGGLATLHGPMLAIDFGDGEPDPYMQGHFAATLWGTEDSESIPCDHGCATGAVAGTLWGGNLSVLAHLVGTPYLPTVDDGLLYLEEIAEEPYAVERLFFQLHHAGVLERCRAVLLGDFSDCEPRNPARYPYAMEEAVETLRAIAPCPVLTGLPFGHVARKLTLPFGSEALLSLQPGSYTLSWPGLAKP